MGVILIVDDSSADRAIFRNYLSREGYSVQEASRGLDALSRIREIRPHVIVLDVNLPDMDGNTICRSVRADPELMGIPILMLTVRHDDRDVLAGLEAGADDYVAKDSAKEIILARVRRLIEFRRLSSVSILNQQLAQLGRLMAGIIHEIRSPLSVIRGSAELLRMNIGREDPNSPWIDSILRGTLLLQIRLEHLMAAVRGGPPDVKPVDLNELVRESVALFVKGLPLDDRKVAIEVDESGTAPRVMADSGRLMQVLFNLLGNAREAIAGTNRGGRIRVRVFSHEEGGKSWGRIDVIDDGPGIPESYRARIFEPFFTTKEGGTGYGLYLAREVLGEQSATIEVRDVDGGGTCFSISIPAAGDIPDPCE
jgi:signal transduction histidine kinase